VISRPSAQSDSAIFFVVLEKGYSGDVRTDFDTKYIKRRGSAKGSAFWGVAKPKPKVSTPIFTKTAILSSISTGLFRPKTALTLDGSRVNEP